MRLRLTFYGTFLSLLLLLPLQVCAAGEAVTKEITVTAADEADYTAQAQEAFAQTLKEDGKKYTLEGITYDVIDTEYLDKKEKVLDVSGEPEQTYTEDGINYTLARAEEQEQEETEPHVVTAYEDYDYRVTEADVPQTKEVTETDPFTGEEVTVTCSLTGIDQAGEQSSEKVMTITFQNYDAAYYVWNGHYIARNDQTPPLAGYEQELLDYCNADGEITGYDWAGEPYTANGVLCRDAAATVRQTTQMYRASYLGEIKAPEQEPKYRATYSAPDTDGRVEMTVKATAIYQPTGISTAVYIVAGAGILLLILLIVLILYLVSKKRYDNEVKGE